MRLLSGKRIGQSGSELTITVVFSGIIHILIVFAAVSLYVVHPPRVIVPITYQVQLVGLPADLSPAPPVETAPPKEEVKPAPPIPAAKKQASNPIKSAPKPGAMPELSSKKPKQTEEQPPSNDTTGAQSQPPAKASSEKAALSSGGVENVSTPTQQDFKFPYYLGQVREKIGQNWRPTPDAPDAKARVIFTINRSGVVLDVNLDSENTSGKFEFKQAAMRAIQSSHFPPLPEDYPKQTLDFSVDLIPK